LRPFVETHKQTTEGDVVRPLLKATGKGDVGGKLLWEQADNGVDPSETPEAYSGIRYAQEAGHVKTLGRG
jgi:hypothetical protein